MVQLYVSVRVILVQAGSRNGEGGTWWERQGGRRNTERRSLTCLDSLSAYRSTAGSLS